MKIDGLIFGVHYSNIHITYYMHVTNEVTGIEMITIIICLMK